MRLKLSILMTALALVAMMACKEVKPDTEKPGGDNTEKPIEPGIPEIPDVPDDPDDPSDPNQPDDPTDPNDPTDPEEPTDPEKPIDPELPIVPSFVPKVLFFENFSTITDLPQEYKAYDIDQEVDLYWGQKASWQVKQNSIVSYGKFKKEVTTPVDDWVVLPGIKIERENTRLSWYANALTGMIPPPGVPLPDTREKYEVYISTVGQQVGHMTSTIPVFRNESLKLGTTETPEVNLDAYVGQTIYVAFRHYNTPPDADILQVSNIKVREYADNDLQLTSITTNQHVYKAGVQVPLSFTVFNSSNNPVSEVKARYEYGSQIVEQTFPVNLSRESAAKLTFTQTINVDGSDEAKMINLEILPDQDQNQLNNKRKLQIVGITQEPTKKVLVEKCTSYNCKPCGSGINLIEKWENDNPGKVIGVSVHVDGVIGNDNMHCEDYVAAMVNCIKVLGGGGSGINEIFGSLPRTFGSRFMNLGMWNFNYAKSFAAGTAPAEMGLDIQYDPIAKQITAAVNTTFATTALADGYFGLGLSVIEDGLMGGQAGVGSNVAHNHTARALLGGPYGEKGSLPEKVIKGVKNSYTFTHVIPERYGKDTGRVPNPDKMYVIAYLYDSMTGEVLNCEKVKLTSAL